MHVAFWSPAWPLEKHSNGIITYVHAMKLELERRGHRVSVFTETLDDPGTEQRAFRVTRSRWVHRVNRLLRKSGRDPVFDFSSDISAAMLREHRRNPIDIVEMEESFGWFADVQLRTSLPMVVKLHGPAFASLVEGELQQQFAREKIEREGIALRAAEFIVSPSESTLQETLQRYQLAPAAARVVVNPVLIERETPIWRLDGCDRDAVLFVGRFDLRKGGDIVLQAFSRLLQARPALKLIFVGPDRGLPGPDGGRIPFDDYCTGLLSPSLRSQVDYRGALSTSEIEQLRVKAMVTVVASRWESQGYTLLEAMAQGCPVVSSEVGALRESVTHGSTGLLARCADPVDFADKISSILDDPELASRLGRAARQHVMERHAPEKVVDAMLGIYRQVAGMHRSKAGSGSG